ncbi:MAG: hypothetical protein N2313_07705 [Meiothermus ruber]|nr:hypothetical protein [Meiothermus ruber]
MLNIRRPQRSLRPRTRLRVIAYDLVDMREQAIQKGALAYA